MENKGKRQFEELMAEYNMPNVAESRKEEIITLMQEYLQKNYGERCVNVKCPNGKTFPTLPDNIEDLRVIEATLRAEEKRKNNQENAEKICDRMTSMNKYSEEHPYPGQ
ncbi:MAG: hypothetical protein KBT27_11085 [Prevotellaceae bacterium]|nr:hypothetical protein [Candidatus Faecinaster equi]MBQ0164483.1 hypothetical protein [Candidatus Equimonas faecalis]